MTIYDKVIIRKVSNGWIVTYYRCAKETEEVFADFGKALKVVSERVK